MLSPMRIRDLGVVLGTLTKKWFETENSAGHNTHNNVLLGDSRVQIIHSHLGAFQRAEDRLPQTRALPEAKTNSSNRTHSL